MPELKIIGDFAFECCYALDSMPDLSNVTDIGMFAFSHCHGPPECLYPRERATCVERCFLGLREFE